MRAARYDTVGGPISLVEVDPPACPADGIVVEVRATGVCRSDWHAWRGHDPVPLPHVPGHEFAGVIAEVGPQVRRWQVGDRVTVPFVCGCGRCEFCLAGDTQVCPDQRQPGFTDPGSFAERVAVPAADHNAVRLPDGLPFVTAALLGCRFATAYRAVTVHGRVGRGDRVAVFGCGGAGLSAVLIAVALGAEVTAVDVSAAALDRVRALGATVAVLADPAEPPDVLAGRVVAAAGGEVHVGLDCAGQPTLLAASVLALRRRGRHVQVGLLLGAHARPAMPMDVVIARELELYGSHGMAAHEYPAMLELVVDGTLRPDVLIGRTVGLADAGAALAAMAAMDSADPTAGVTVIELNLEVGRRRRTLPAPPHVVADALRDPDRYTGRPWLRLEADEQLPDVTAHPTVGERRFRLSWSGLWPSRPDARVCFDLEPDDGAGTALTWTLVVDGPGPDASKVGHLRKRVNELIFADLRASFGQ